MTRDVVLAEDLAQDALVAAREQWHRRRPGRPARGRRRWHRVDPRHSRKRLQAEELPRGRRAGHPDGTCRAFSATSPGGFGIGTDPNRNYGGFWGGPGASATFADPTYRGAGPFSEPETQNIRELVSGRQVTTLISNHTFSNLVLRPNGVHPDTIGPDGHPVGNAPDEEGLKALGAEMTAANGYRNIHGWELYDTTGTTEDWSYNATGGYGYTFEIGPNEFLPPFPQVIDEYLGAGEYAGQGNREAYLDALENTVDTATHSVIRGSAPKGATLRLRKQFATPTWESSFTDTLNTTMRVGNNGKFAWHINQSTRQVVQEKLVGSPRTSRSAHSPTRVARPPLVKRSTTTSRSRRPASTCSRWPSTGRPRTTSTSRSTRRTRTAR